MIDATTPSESAPAAEGVADDKAETLVFSQHLACNNCGLSFDELAPRNFSFNSPYGACEACDGLGTTYEVDPELVVPQSAPIDSTLARGIADRRFQAMLFLLFGVVALMIAAVGIYGVMAYLVSQGTRDIGIRMALGATARSVLGLVLRQGTLIAAIGLFAGLAGAWALTRFMQSLLFGVSGTDALTFSAVATLLGAVAILATLIPARRAARIDPIVALRSD